MALNTFTPAVRPGPGAKIKPTIKIKSASFGDGYSQEAPDGLNHIRDSVELTWETLSAAEALAMETFMRQQKGTVPFWFDVDVGVMRKWTCKAYERGAGPVGSFTATFVESFLPVL